MEYLIQIVAGLVTGNATGTAAKGVSLGTVGNSPEPTPSPSTALGSQRSPSTVVAMVK